MLPEAPRYSLDPTDWRMYCDLLQDADAPSEEWQKARRIAESLEGEPNLILINYCAAEHLANHYLRVGETWFIGGTLTRIHVYPVVWWRPAWVLDGFERYPTSDPDRTVGELIALNLGTPWHLPHPLFEEFRARDGFEAILANFFDTHGHVEMPAEYR